MFDNPPLREIHDLVSYDDGVAVTLSCGHVMWLAGRKASEFASKAAGMNVISTDRCRAAPCYKLTKSMGKS